MSCADTGTRYFSRPSITVSSTFASSSRIGVRGALRPGSRRRGESHLHGDRRAYRL